MLLSLIIALPGILTRWVFLKRPIGKLKALVIVIPIWLILLWLFHYGGGEGSPTFISLGVVLMYFAFVAPKKIEKKSKSEPSTPDPSAGG